MACAPTPTETQYADVVTTTVVQTVSDSVTVLPPSVTTLTLVSQSCFSLSGPGGHNGCVPVDVTSVSTVDGTTTMSDGGVYLTVLTITSTFGPTAIVVPSPAPATTHYNVTGASDDGPRNVTAPVVGGVLGGFFGFFGLVVIGWIVWRKRHRIFGRNTNPAHGMSYNSPPPSPVYEPKPKPYEYGLIGRDSSHPSREPSATFSSFPLTVRDSYASLGYQDVPFRSHSQGQVQEFGQKAQQRPVSSGSQDQGQRHRLSSSGSQGQGQSPRYYGHASSPSLKLSPGHSRSTTGSSSTPLLSTPPLSLPFSNSNAPYTYPPETPNTPNPPSAYFIPQPTSSTAGTRSSSGGRYDSGGAYQHPHEPYMQLQQAQALPPGAAQPILRQSWPSQYQSQPSQQQEENPGRLMANRS
ncbi:unnamed protein product [Somion occarium]|uniref:Transmembrane protein n=1 Tax=Somion occarium TaxID=3059160 RepID=A0ABP1DUT2_9APHY